MTIRTSGGKNTRFYGGVLESAGLSEVAYFLKKARQDVIYAAVSMQNAELKSVRDEVEGGLMKIESITSSIDELSRQIDALEQAAVNEVVRREYEDTEGEGRGEEDV